MIYRVLIRPFLYLLPAETAHHLAIFLLRMAQAIPGVRALLNGVYSIRNPALEVEALGQVFPNPVGLAAGFDKDAVAYHALGALGFGSVEIGTVTGQAQPGNPTPRLFRLPKDEALINRMGFNNRGSAAAAPRLRGTRSGVVGVNIGKTKAVLESDAVQDYILSTRRLAALADYFVVNVSSPNTPGLRNLQAVEKLRPLLAAVRQTLDEATGDRRVPLLVKIAPDLADEDVDEVADLALELGLDGIIATNTTVERGGLLTAPATVQGMGNGGLSGQPLVERSLSVLKRLRARVGDRVTLISVGGISTAEQAWARIRAGATLIQLYSALVYEGPGLPGRLNRGLIRLAKEAGFERVQDAVGTAQSS